VNRNAKHKRGNESQEMRRRLGVASSSFNFYFYPTGGSWAMVQSQCSINIRQQTQDVGEN